MNKALAPFPVTPDGRYFVVKGRLWRMSNPGLDPDVREALVAKLMAARREVGVCGRRGDLEGQRQARGRIDEAKRGLGERGPVWWLDGAPDENRRMVRNTSYAVWFEGLEGEASP
jgi:hypothetical protein